ncbi:outer membrane lipoprotein-sorting protein [Bacillus ectoiniformans]|uniref:LolA family protein n=1 Tax=Bacillus ectoiniformans TaxID=1494429 RepID=UPI00195AE100|nr:outer membrane lipoprotein carrier protein LolA [Bacillus ectoiniformans]MBM7649399.1 outer membrane lipoprotein-sorting protein [Bacillus ectoiniformans]
MTKKWTLWLVSLFALFMLSACGEKSKEDVAADLSEKAQEVKGYKATAEMTLQAGEEKQKYHVEIWNKEHQFYRVELTADKKDQSQMILKNDSGVYVLTPALNKSFKFQSDWPKNSSQAYLYESLVKDIAEDKEASFKETDKHYVFETKTRYPNSHMLPLQEITFNKKDLSPVSVKVMDADRKSLVDVKFTKMNFDASFEKASFDMKKNMTGAQLEIPVSTETKDKELSVSYPSAKIKGTSLLEENEMITASGKRVVLTYGGAKSFTLIQEKAEVLPAAAMETAEVEGEIADLGFAVGTMTKQSLSWSYKGINYMLASKDLSQSEMMEVAKSMNAAAMEK